MTDNVNDGVFCGFKISHGMVLNSRRLIDLSVHRSDDPFEVLKDAVNAPRYDAVEAAVKDLL